MGVSVCMSSAGFLFSSAVRVLTVCLIRVLDMFPHAVLGSGYYPRQTGLT